MAFETGWLIEREASSPVSPEYLTLDGHVSWTSNPNRAVRFARFEDAKAFCKTFFAGGGRCAEHGWGP